jgi:hypothetical protein
MEEELGRDLQDPQGVLHVTERGMFHTISIKQLNTTDISTSIDTLVERDLQGF